MGENMRNVRYSPSRAFPGRRHQTCRHMQRDPDSERGLPQAAWPRTGEEQVPLGGLLPLLQTGVEQAQQLQDALLSAGLGQAGVIHHQVGVDLAVVAPDVQAAGRRVVLLDDLHPGHEPGDTHTQEQVRKHGRTAGEK